MQNTIAKSSRSAEGLYKFFIYFVLVLLAVTIIVPVAWVFMASIKQLSLIHICGNEAHRDLPAGWGSPSRPRGQNEWACPCLLYTSRCV